jgi:hypothetical protein
MNDSGVKLDATLKGKIKKCKNCGNEVNCDEFFSRSRRYDQTGLEAYFYCSHQCYYDFNKEEIEVT